MTLIKVKSKDAYGILTLPSRRIAAGLDIAGQQFERRSLNKVVLEDGSICMVRDEDIEEVKDDRPKKSKKKTK